MLRKLLFHIASRHEPRKVISKEHAKLTKYNFSKYTTRSDVPFLKLQGQFKAHLRWLERVFKCYKPFETRKDYKEVFLSMWVIYEFLDNSFIGQYFKTGCDVIAVTMTTLTVHKKNPQISVFANYPKN